MPGTQRIRIFLMLRREFLQGSAIVGASLVMPRILRASSGMWAEGGERKIAGC